MKTKLSKNFLANYLGCKSSQIRRILPYRFSRFECLYIVERSYSGVVSELMVVMSSVFLSYGSISKFDFVLMDNPIKIQNHILDEVMDYIAIIRAQMDKVSGYKIATKVE